jgi:hypothetical protein
MLLMLATMLALPGCGGKANNAPAPFPLSVTIGMPTLTIQQGGQPILQPITIMAPTETTTFVVSGLPAGVNATYKPSESNPSGLMTLTANASATIGSTMPVITVGTKGETATTTFTLVVTAAKKSGFE